MTRINTNVSSLIGRNNLNRANASLSQALTRLSTGLRINTGKDDPAGLIASENLRSDITSIGRAISNTDRANQVIATADSALGQVSSLLNDIRGLVTESANAGALSDEQIAANQLQLDSSLEALNRIAQTTTFQGRRLLDGSLDFLTTAGTNFTNVSNLQIDQANLGATGSVAVDVEVTTSATQALVDIESIPPGSGSAAPATSSLTLTLAQAATQSSASQAISVEVDDVQASTTGTGGSSISLANPSSGAAVIDVSAISGQDLDGTAGNITIQFADTATAGSETTALAGGVLTVGIEAGVSTLQQVIDAINAHDEGGTAGVDLNAVLTSGTAGDAFAVADIAETGTLAAGADATTVNSTFTGTNATGENFDLNIVVADTGGAITVSGTTAGGTVTVTVDDNDTSSTLQDIADAINGAGIGLSDAAFTNATTLFDATYSTNAAFSETASYGGGVEAVNGDVVIDLETTGNVETYNGYTFNITEGGGTAGTVTAALDTGNTEIDINITGTVTVQDILDALDGLGTGSEFTSSINATGTTAGLSATNSYVEASDSITDGGALAGGEDGGGLTAAVTFELSGANGSEVLNFGVGTTIADLVAGINLVSDATGVTAAINGTTTDTLDLTSTAYGSNAFVDINIISEGTGATPAGTFTTAVGQGERNEGTDIVASINGVQATGDGNKLTINTATLDLSATITADFTGTASFTITGGGALFQLGPDVVSTQQARLGIGSVNTARLGGVAGKLFQLGTGGTASLSSTNLDTAGDIVAQAIDQVTSLRGRLGAFQRTTLETNKNALNDTLSNLTEAESSIRDADFAAETAALTRAQILVQSGSRILAIANQNPQNALALLG